MSPSGQDQGEGITRIPNLKGEIHTQYWSRRSPISTKNQKCGDTR